MIINGQEYTYRIEPTPYRSVRAEISSVHKDYNILVINKHFGKFYRGIRTSDYEDAKKWVMAHLENIRIANES